MFNMIGIVGKVSTGHLERGFSGLYVAKIASEFMVEMRTT